ncbi:MAG: universal stress protein [Rhizobiaceae bacterium]|nr:universal stress protein [Rhizobiaceae bacterium]
MKRRALVPLVTYPDANSEAVAAGAAAAAKLLGAELHALALVADIPDVSNALSRVMLDVKAMERSAEQRSRDARQRLLDAVVAAAKAAGVEATTNSVTGAPDLAGELAAAHARYFDWTIVGWEGATHPARQVAEAAMFGGGRPVVILPHGKAPASLGHIAIAWDGGRACARALGDAMPLLEKAKKVSVLTVLDEKPLKEKDAGQRLAGELERRGLPVAFKAIKAEDQAIDTTLQEHALEASADLLVMGAFGHSRLRDFVLGGATKGVLTDLRMPVMLSH